MTEQSSSAFQPGSNRARRLISLLALSTCLVTQVTLGTTLVRVDLSGAGSCMDGSPPAFYYDSTVTSDRWIIILEGSNLCKGADGIEADTAADCQTWCNMDEADPQGLWYDAPQVCDLKMEDIAGWLPRTFSVYLTASSKHLYMVTKDDKCDDGRGGCWHHVNNMKQLDTGVVQAVSKHDVPADFLLGNVGKYRDVDDYRH